MWAVIKKNVNRAMGPGRSSSAPMKVRMRLTASGWGFGGLIFCVFAMSVNYSNNLIFAMTFLLIAIALMGWYHTYVNMRGLIVADWRNQDVFAGQKMVYRLAVENPSRQRRHGLLAKCADSLPMAERHLAGGEQIEITLERQTMQRGRLIPIAAHIQSCFPLGIFQAVMCTGPLPEGLVYPQPIIDGAPLPDREVGRQAHLLAESGTYTDMRRYVPGDPLSRIHWQAMARCDELYTKTFDGTEGHPALWLCWQDVKASGVEEKLSQLCRWVLDANQQNREYGLEVPGKRIEPANDPAHFENCLRALALYGASETSS